MDPPGGRQKRQQRGWMPWRSAPVRRSDGTEPSGGPTSGGPQTGAARSQLTEMNGVRTKLLSTFLTKKVTGCYLFDTKRKFASVESAFAHAIAPQHFETEFMNDGKPIQNMHTGRPLRR